MRRKPRERPAPRLPVPRAEEPGWAGGGVLPSEPQARLLDEYLTARGAIQNLVIELLSRPDRPGLRLVPAPLPSPPAATLLQTFQNIAAALRGCLVRDADGRPMGWLRDLRELPELPGEATPTSTAYGVK